MVVEAWLARAAAQRAPSARRCRRPRGAWSYAQLHAAARFGAGELAARGAGPGARVAIALPAGLDFAQALHACLLLGAVAVPVDLRLSAAERAQIADGAAVLRRASRWAAGPVPPRAIAGAGGHDLDATAVVIHTSGTTAAPRPVELTYGNFLWSALGSAVALGLDPRERWLCALPLSHVGGLSILVRSAIYATTAVVHERFEERSRAARAATTQEVTLVSLVATTLARLLDAGLERPPALRCALTGGGPVPAALLQRARAAGVPVSLTYGLTESCSQVDDHAPSPRSEDARDQRRTAAVLHARADRRGSGDPGRRADRRARLRSPPTAGCTPAISARSTSAAACSSRGRKADTIVSGGENVAPAEVEAVLEAHPQVLEAAVLGRPDPQWGEAVTAIVVARAGRPLLEAEELRAHCARALAPYKVPKQCRAQRRAAAAHALGQAAAQGAASELRRERLPAGEPGGLGRGGPRLGAPPGADARARRAGVALDARRARRCSRASACSSSPAASARRACSPPSWSPRSAA